MSVVVLVSLIALLASLAAAGGARAATEPSRAAADPTPVMGWSSRGFLRFGIETERIEKEVRALVSTGLVKYGYNHVNIDDNWYICPGSQGPTVDRYGRWVVDPTEFSSVGGRNGIAVLSAYVHHLGLKFGIYETAGISKLDGITDRNRADIKVAPWCAGSDLDHRGGAWPAGQPGWLPGQGPVDGFGGDDLRGGPDSEDGRIGGRRAVARHACRLTNN